MSTGFVVHIMFEVYNCNMLIMLILIIAGFLFCVFHFSDSSGKSGKTRYEKTGSWADFDPGIDKIDPKNPKTASDWLEKEEFLDSLSKDR